MQAPSPYPGRRHCLVQGTKETDQPASFSSFQVTVIHPPLLLPLTCPVFPAGPSRILGVSVKTPEQARAALEAGADYLGAGAVLPTGTTLYGSVQRGLM